MHLFETFSITKLLVQTFYQWSKILICDNLRRIDKKQAVFKINEYCLFKFAFITKKLFELETLVESLNTSACINQLLLARKKRMTL